MGEADSRNYQGRFLSEDYTMGDLIRNSNIRESPSDFLWVPIKKYILIRSHKKITDKGISWF